MLLSKRMILNNIDNPENKRKRKKTGDTKPAEIPVVLQVSTPNEESDEDMIPDDKEHFSFKHKTKLGLKIFTLCT